MRLFLLAVLVTLGVAGISAERARAQGTPERSAPACHLQPRPNTLWSLVECCSLSITSNTSCTAYDAKRDYVIIKDNDPKKSKAYLIMPTAKVTGMEDPQIFQPSLSALWKDGWEIAEKYIARPAAGMGLAINSRDARTQNQLHIHISCVRADVARVLADAQDLAFYPGKARAMRLPPDDKLYQVVKVRKLDGVDNPFEIGATSRVPETMGNRGTAVVGAANADEYYVLNTYRGDGSDGSSEELLAQTCP